ncbi:MAG: von Willebrand factor type A domain-containing protein [Phycisphaerae bacterium]|nr:von Willebrand factor type A domain-containing protein [Phycisphaerae bacterium]
MNRDQAEKLLAALVFDDLDESSKAELLTYLQTDDDLRDRLADMRMATKLTCDAVNDGPDPVLAERRLKKLRQLAGVRGSELRISIRRSILAAAAVLVVGVVLIGLLIPSLNKVRHREYRVGSTSVASDESAAAVAHNTRAAAPQRTPAVRGNPQVPLGGSQYATRSRRSGGMAGGASEPMNGPAYGRGIAGGITNGTVISRSDADGEPPSDGVLALSEMAAEPSEQPPSGTPVTDGRWARAGDAYRAVPLTSLGKKTAELEQESELRTGQVQAGLRGQVWGDTGADEAVKMLITAGDLRVDAREGEKTPYGLVTSGEGLVPPSGPTSSSSRVSGPASDRLEEKPRSTSAAPENYSRQIVSYEYSGAVTPGAPPVTTPAPVPAQPAPTSDEKGDMDLSLLSGWARADGRVPALGDTPTLGRLVEIEQQADEDSGALWSYEDSARKKQAENTPLIAAKSDQLVIADRAESLVLEDMPGLDTALPSFQSRFRVTPVNPWVMTQRDAQSTFALDVDTASYALCRRYIRSGFLPPIGAVRMEEFINAFDYAYPQRDGATFSVYAEGAPSPFAPAGQDLTLLKVAVKARTVGRDQRRTAHIVFVVDASASMGQPDRLPLVQSALNLLVDKLDDADRISLVTCADDARLHLEAVPAKEKETIRQTIDAIQPAGRTNLLAGLKVGYDLARRAFVAGRINQVVLCSDGVANVGRTEADDVLAEVAQDRQQGITLTCVGVGYGAYNDAFLEAMADRGDGRYVFLDSSDDARETLVGQLAATLQTVAKDARIQVQFDPTRVRRYRLIGYENRDIEDRRFRDDTVDAGEVGSGQCSTALYEMELMDSAAGEFGSDLGAVFVRYRNSETGQIEEISRPLAGSLIRRRTVEEDPRFFLAAGAARFAEWLRRSEHARDASLQQIQDVLDRVRGALPLDQSVRDLAALVHQAENLPRATQTQPQP